MPFTYCQECGSKNEYTIKKPNFCASCGHPINSSASSQTEGKVYKKEAVKEISQANLDDEGSDIFHVPQLSKLEYEIDMSNPIDQTVGSILGDMAPKENSAKPAVKKTSRRKNAKK